MLKKILVATCVLAIVARVDAQCTFTSAVPYSESFNTFSVNNQLPACWATSSTVTALTFSGTAGYAAFFANPSAVSYFYTNGVQLYTNVVYSVSINYAVDQPGSNWSSIALLCSGSQTSTSLSMIVSSTVAAVSNTTYAQLTNTFVVSGSGIYYFAIRGVSNATSSSQYMMWDDFQVSIPCSVSANQPSLTVVANPTAVCIGKSATLTASSGYQYQWNNGATTRSIVATPSGTGTSQYVVTATRTLTGCSATSTLNLAVNPVPNVAVNALPGSLCSGGTGVLFASGAQNYQWVGMINVISLPIQTIAPTTATTYSVIGTSAAGCTGQASVTVIVNPSPNIQLSTSPNVACAGQFVTIQATGANTYTWTGGNGNGSSITVTPGKSTTYNVNGSANGCTSTASITVDVQDCTMIPYQPGDQATNVFPNPARQVVNIQVASLPAYAEITDLSGRVMKRVGLDATLTELTLDMPAGIYVVKVCSAGGQQFVRLVHE